MLSSNFSNQIVRSLSNFVIFFVVHTGESNRCASVMHFYDTFIIVLKNEASALLFFFCA